MKSAAFGAELLLPHHVKACGSLALREGGMSAIQMRQRNVTAILPPSSANALVPIDSRRHVPAGKGPEMLPTAAEPIADQHKSLVPVAAPGQPKSALPATIPDQSPEAAGPARDIAAYRQADGFGDPTAGTGQIID